MIMPHNVFHGIVEEVKIVSDEKIFTSLFLVGKLFVFFKNFKFRTNNYKPM